MPQPSNRAHSVSHIPVRVRVAAGAPPRAVRVAVSLMLGAALGGVGAAGAQDTPTAVVPRLPVAVQRVARGRPEALASPLDYVPVERYRQIRDLVVRTRSEGGTLFNAPDGQTSYVLAHRTTASEVEEHSRWDDVIVVRSGTGALEVGPRTTGARLAAPGELRGGTLVAPSRLVLRPGDMARIPAGTPHAFVPGTAEPWEA